MRGTCGAADVVAGRISRWLVATLALLIAACYPELDWREVTSARGGYAVLMPAAPEEATRDVALGGVTLVTSMTSVRREGMAFGAAYADIPPGSVRNAELLAAARDALVRNIAGRITADRAISVGDAAGREFYAEGSVEGRALRLAARVLVAGRRFYQVAYIGQADRLAQADVELFLGSFRLLRQ